MTRPFCGKWVFNFSTFSDGQAKPFIFSIFMRIFATTYLLTTFKNSIHAV
jgi:hypothetical protein